MKRRDFLLSSLLGAAGICLRNKANASQLLDLLQIIPPHQPINDFPIVPHKFLSKRGATLHVSVDEMQIKKWGMNLHLRGYNNQSLPTPMFEIPEKGVHKVHITNNLTEDTTIHWHGLDIETKSDGNPHFPIKAKIGNKAGGKMTHILDMKHVRPGTYWYHPHPHGAIARQIAHGLAGPLIVREDNPVINAPIKEQILMFTEMSFNDKFQAVGNSRNADEIAFGRELDIIFTNGQLTPKLSIKRNSTVRFRLINALGARYLLLNFGGAPIIQIGSDGGYIERPQEIKEIFLCPGERMDVLVHFEGDAGAQFTLKSALYKRSFVPEFNQKPIPNDLLLVECTEEAGELYQPPAQLTTIEKFGAPDSYKQVLMTEANIVPYNADFQEYMKLLKSHHNHHSHANHAIDHESHQNIIPTRTFNFSTRFFDINRVDLISKAKEVEEWTIVNNTLMDHPFHIHGGQFQITEHGYQKKITKPAFSQWKDVVNVRSGEILKFHMIQHYKGLKMFHCHITDHEDHGMMGVLKVI